ncbi:type II secretion system protein GspL [Pseudomonas sp. SWRI102]|uniref:Type II secretion system protein GspL n=1 Tax=Pseudomonas marvdashtae TaxID=2745500 RepID=A0A923JPQ6_9PSED|nr:type II secretion system protein GspL [Pseudomonas marvdashtae]MBV4552224.1 type II secretion system protein GspL [Pseudomonas marvdashtae]
MSVLLRMALAPLAQLNADSLLECAWLDRKGALVKQGRQSLRELSSAAQAQALELCLHPQDSLLACVELPPLPAARLGDAVRCAADNLLLGSDDTVHLVHGPRDIGGQVQLAWFDRAALQRLSQLLQTLKLQPRGLYAAPCFLSLAEAGACTATWVEDHLLVREDLQRAWVHPLMEEGLEQLRERTVRWVGARPESLAGVDPLPGEQRWIGPVPSWSLLSGIEQNPRGNQRWGRAAACCAVAALIWTLGLNLYAMRLADEGQAIKRQMVSRVQQVFPELPVVLNPLQQARQQRDARRDGAQAEGPVSFAVLVRQAVGHLPFMAGAVDKLDFDGTELHLTPRAPARKPPAESSWQASLAQGGIQADLANGQWTLKRLPADAKTTSVAEAADE